MPPAPSSASTRYTPSRTPLASDTMGSKEAHYTMRLLMSHGPGVYKVSREAVTSRLPALLDHGAWLRGSRCTAPTHGATPRRGRRRRRIRRVDGPAPPARGRGGRAAARAGTGQQPRELRRGDTRHPHDLRAHAQVRRDGGARDGALARMGSHLP